MRACARAHVCMLVIWCDQLSSGGSRWNIVSGKLQEQTRMTSIVDLVMKVRNLNLTLPELRAVADTDDVSQHTDYPSHP